MIGVQVWVPRPGHMPEGARDPMEAPLITAPRAVPRPRPAAPSAPREVVEADGPRGPAGDRTVRRVAVALTARGAPRVLWTRAGVETGVMLPGRCCAATLDGGARVRVRLHLAPSAAPGWGPRRDRLLCHDGRDGDVRDLLVTAQVADGPVPGALALVRASRDPGALVPWCWEAPVRWGLVDEDGAVVALLDGVPAVPPWCGAQVVTELPRPVAVTALPLAA